MTNKDNFQQELKEKVKPGIKPSDIKKQAQKLVKNPISPSPIVQSEDEGYISEEEEKINFNNEVPNPEIKKLQNQIKTLERQLTTYQDFKNADLKIKEKYKKEIEQLKKQNQDLDYLLKTGKNSDIINKLQTKIKEQEKTIEELKNEENDKEKPINKSFFCDSCQLNKIGSYIIRKVDSPFDLRLHGRTCYLCSACSPYVKEINEANFDKDNNPYKLD